MLLLHVARVKRVGDGSELFPHHLPVQADGIAVGDGSRGKKVEIRFARPFFPVTGGHFHGMLYLLLIEEDAKAFSPDRAVLYAKSNFHILCISCGLLFCSKIMNLMELCK